MIKDDLRRLTKEDREAVTGPALTVIEHLYEALLAMPPIVLPNGEIATLTPYFAPMVDNDDAKVSCGFDMVFSDGTELEFTLINTGWGKRANGRGDSADASGGVRS